MNHKKKLPAWGGGAEHKTVAVRFLWMGKTLRGVKKTDKKNTGGLQVIGPNGAKLS